jgi:hypothetical protein
MKIFNFLQGYKTYIIGAVTILYGITQLCNQQQDVGIQNIMLGLAMLSGRAAIAKSTK